MPASLILATVTLLITTGVAAGGLEACMTEELGDDDELGAAAHEGRRKRVSEDVDGRVVIEAGGGGDRGDDVVGAAGAEMLRVG